jgi:hypothetical protein
VRLYHWRLPRWELAFSSGCILHPSLCMHCVKLPVLQGHFIIIIVIIITFIITTAATDFVSDNILNT